MARARRTVHSKDRMGGESAEEIAAKINAAVASMEVPTRACAAFTPEELNQAVRDLHCHFSAHLSAALPSNDMRARRFPDLAGYEASWKQEADGLAAVSDAAARAAGEAALRDGKCAEVLMLFAHHTPASAKHALVHEQGLALPTMPAYAPAQHAGAPAAQQQAYASSYTCQSGHGIAQASYNGSDHVLPHWPAEVHYTGAGYGAYPFWLGTGGSGGGPAPIEVWWSEGQAAEKFYHETCYMSEAGYEGTAGMAKAAALSVGKPRAKAAAKQGETTTKNPAAGGLRGAHGRALLQGPPPGDDDRLPPPPGGDDDRLPPPPGGDDDFKPPGPDDDGGNAVSTPCFNLMTGVVGSAKAYLYTAAEDFCCVATGSPEDLAPPQSDFMDDMTLTGTVDITTPYYSGEGYHYQMQLASSEAVDYFWYVTTPEGLPVQQGEGGTDADTPAGRGVFIYHSYNMTAWAQPAVIDADVFAVPDVCLTATATCTLP
jgi:hypothetical protein